MKILINSVIFILVILIKIGDGVLYIIFSPARLLRLFKKKSHIQYKPVEIFNAESLKVKTHEGKKLPQIKISITPLKKFFSFFTKKTPRRKNIKEKKREIKKIIIYHFPFITKLKYFIAGLLFSSIFIFIPLLFAIFLQDLPNPKELAISPSAQTTKIFDRNNVLLYQIYATQNRSIVPLTDIPVTLQEATIAIEDKDFYKHPGFDIPAIVRSALANAAGNNLQGGSTITQQLIKSALLTSETSLKRKLKEVVLAFWTERLFTKNQILEMYFNQVPYGGTSWGVGSASEVYFGKYVKDLDLAESAFLAGIPRAPTIYSPFGETPTLWKKRQKEVLHRMMLLGYISQSDSDKAASEDLQFQTPQVPIYAPHFVLYVKDLLIKKYGLPIVERGGLTVVTSLDLKTQDMAQKIVTDEVNNDGPLNLTNGATLITNPKNGDILAMVGSKDFSDPNSGNVNLTTSLRQPGSSIKVVTYAAALQNGFTAATILDDSPISYSYPGGPSYSPVNYDGKFHGRVSLRIALANSFNIPAVKTLNQIGVPTMVNFGKKMGITTWNDPSRYGLSITLGGAEVRMTDMATVYGTLANGGDRVDLNPIIKLTDSRGDTLEEKIEPALSHIFNTGIAFILSHILADNTARALEFGTNSPLTISNHTVSVKTGTSDNKRDNWTIGYTPTRLVAVWVGNNNNAPMSQTLASGITGAAPIWNKIMTNLLKDNPEQPLTQPADVVQKQCLGRTEYFIKGTENSVNCNPPPSPTISPSPNP